MNEAKGGEVSKLSKKKYNKINKTLPLIFRIVNSTKIIYTWNQLGVDAKVAQIDEKSFMTFQLKTKPF